MKVFLDVTRKVPQTFVTPNFVIMKSNVGNSVSVMIMIGSVTSATLLLRQSTLTYY